MEKYYWIGIGGGFIVLFLVLNLFLGSDIFGIAYSKKLDKHKPIQEVDLPCTEEDPGSWESSISS